MSEIKMTTERAIEILTTKFHFDGPVKIVVDELNARAAGLEALQEKQEREKGCPECRPACHNCKHDVYDDFCSFYGKQGCGNKYFEPKNKFCPNCGRNLGGDGL